MDIIFLIYSLLIAGMAINLWWPVYAPANIALVSFMFGLVANLFALQLFLFHSLVTLAYVYVGEPPAGVVANTALVVAIAGGLGLLFYHVRAYATSQMVERALQEGLGADYILQVAPEIRRHFPNELDMGKIFWPFPQDLPGVELIKNIPFYQPEGSTRQLKLDIYRRKYHGEGRPVLLQIHGGAWTEKMGSKNEQAKPLLNHMALRDWICVSTAYRLSPGATMPEHVIDVKAALLWIKDNIAEYGGDPNYVVVTGGSAGGHLSSLVALSANDPDFQPGYEGADTRVQGCVPFYGAVDFLNDSGHQPTDSLQQFLTESVIKQAPEDAPELWVKLSPVRRIHAQAPPFFVICGDKDTLVPVGSNRSFAENLASVSKESVCFAEIGGAQHAFDLTRTPHSEHVVHAIERWLGFQYTRYLQGLD